MRDRYTRSFASPDEVIEIEGVRSEIVDLGGITLARDTHQPGWRWSTHVRPLVGTEWCESRHVGLVLKGRMHVLTIDGAEFDVAEGDVIDLPPGHDAWVVGDEVLVTVAWMGARTWLMPLHALKERVLVTLVFTDIVDSTGTARRLGDRAWTELLASHDQRLADVVDQFRGRVAKLTGDGMLAVFDGAARAIRCALTCRKAVSDLGLSIRAAVHTGEIGLVGDEIHGLAVHEASRILKVAQANEVLVSATTADLVRDAELSFDDRGEHELRGLNDLRRLFAVTERT
jgi:class 3 adenylate cyclase